jgi:hypothetical protein
MPASYRKISTFIQAMDEENGEKLWDSIKDANRSGSLHFGKHITFLYPSDKAERAKIIKDPSLVDNLVMTRHMYYTTKPGSNWRCWENYAKAGESRTTTDAHILIELGSIIDSKSIKLKGGQIVKIITNWEYGDKNQVAYTFEGPIPTGKKTYIEGAMEMDKLQNWENDPEYSEDLWHDDSRYKIESLARTSLIYDMKKSDTKTPSAYCQFVTSFLESISDNKELSDKAHRLMSPSTMISFYIIFFASADTDLEKAVVKWSETHKLESCCTSKDSCIAAFKKHLESGQKQITASIDQYLSELSKISVGATSSTAYDAIVKLYSRFNNQNLVKNMIWRDFIRLQIIKFLHALDREASIVSSTVKEPKYSDSFVGLLSKHADNSSMLNDLIVNNIIWDPAQFDPTKEDRRNLVEIIRTLPQEPPKTNDMAKKIKEEGFKPSDPSLSPLDMTTIQEKMRDMYSL